MRKATIITITVFAIAAILSFWTMVAVSVFGSNLIYIPDAAENEQLGKLVVRSVNAQDGIFLDRAHVSISGDGIDAFNIIVSDGTPISLNEGSYKITEIATPSGYRRLSSAKPIIVHIEAGKTSEAVLVYMPFEADVVHSDEQRYESWGVSLPLPRLSPCCVCCSVRFGVSYSEGYSESFSTGTSLWPFESWGESQGSSSSSGSRGATSNLCGLGGMNAE